MGRNFVRRLPAIKCILISERVGETCFYTRYAEDIGFVQDLSPAFLTGVAAGMGAIYQDITSQFAKMGECKGLDVGLQFPDYFVKKAAVGEHIILLIICAMEGLDIGVLDDVVQDYRTALEPVDRELAKMQQEQ